MLGTRKYSARDRVCQGQRLIVTARRYAKRGICRRRVSVCLWVYLYACAYHTLVLY